MTKQDWLDELRKPGFVTEAVAAIQMAALENDVQLTAEPWEIARAIGSMIERERNA